MSDNESGIVPIGEDRIRKTIPYSFDMERIEKSNCKLCKSEFRDETEAFYEAQPRKNYTAIRNMLLQKHNFDISLNAIKNHMLYHFSMVEKHREIAEYADDLQKWVSFQGDKISSIRTRIGILEREMINHATEGEDLKGDEKRKNSEMIRKLAESILLHQEKLEQIEEEVKPVAIVFQQLQIIINDEMKDVTNVSVKKVLVKVLDRLQKSIGDMLIV